MPRVALPRPQYFSLVYTVQSQVWPLLAETQTSFGVKQSPLLIVSNRRDDFLLGRRWSPLPVLQRVVIRSKPLPGGSPSSSGPPEDLSALHTCSFVLEEPPCVHLLFCVDPCLMWAGSACVVVDIGCQLGQMQGHLGNW